MAAGGRLLALAVLVMVAAAAAYYAAVALGWLAIGTEPGEPAVGEGFVFVTTLLALLAGTGVFIKLGTHRRPRPDVLASAIALAAAGFLVARFYSYDPYFAPSLRRFSEGGSVTAPWVYTLVALAVLAAALIATLPRLGLALGIPLLPIVAFTAFGMGLGH